MRAQRKRGLQLLVVVVLLLALFSLLRNLPGNPLTGFATFGTEEDVLGEVQQFLAGFAPLGFVGDGADICLVIDLGFGSFYAYHIEKSGGEATITPTGNANCAGTSDFVIKFISYTEFQAVASNPSCGAFLDGGRGEQFWYLPSRLWPPGDEPLCNAEFRQKYCAALYYCGDPAALSSTLSCCAKEELTPAQLSFAATATRAGIGDKARGERSVVLEGPLASFAGVRPFLAWGLGVLIVVALIIGALLLLQKERRKGEGGEEAALQSIKSYIQMTKASGFSDEEIRHELRTKGWPEDMIEANLGGERV